MRLPQCHDQAYQYRPLEKEKRIIRLLSFVTPDEKCRDIDDGDVALAIHEYDMTSGPVPDYIALSYTWGTSGRVVPVVADGARLNITASLNDALRHLKHIHVQWNDLRAYWWIDMICINQDDDEERGHQVYMMQDIFKTAQLVVAWLGGTSCDRKCEAFLQYIREASPSDDGEHIREVSDEIDEGGRALLNHPWWSRLWIIQEVVLARRVTIACGNETGSWEDIRPFIRSLEVFGPQKPQKMALNLAMLSEHEDIRQGNLPFVGGLSWLLATTAYDSKCTDPRDRVYALLGMVQEHDIVPDYSLSPCAVYCTAIRAIARRWSDKEMKKITRPFIHANLDQEGALLNSDCDGQQCGTWNCLLDIAQFEWGEGCITLTNAGSMDFLISPDQAWLEDSLPEHCGSQFDDDQYQSDAWSVGIFEEECEDILRQLKCTVDFSWSEPTHPDAASRSSTPAHQGCYLLDALALVFHVAKTSLHTPYPGLCWASRIGKANSADGWHS